MILSIRAYLQFNKSFKLTPNSKTKLSICPDFSDCQQLAQAELISIGALVILYRYGCKAARLCLESKLWNIVSPQLC